MFLMVRKINRTTARYRAAGEIYGLIFMWASRSIRGADTGAVWLYKSFNMRVRFIGTQNALEPRVLALYNTPYRTFTPYNMSASCTGTRMLR